MKKITLLKKYGPTGLVPIFYKGVGTNLVEITKNGAIPLLMKNAEYDEALKRGFGVAIKKGIASVEDIEDKIGPEPVIPVPVKSSNIPEPATVINNTTLVVKDLKKKVEQIEVLVDDAQPEPAKQAPKRSRSRKK